MKKYLVLTLTGLILMTAPAFAEQSVSDHKSADRQSEYLIQRAEHKYQKKIADINEDFQEDVAKIQKSDMPDALKTLRLKHAAEQRDLELKQAAEKNALRQKHIQETAALMPDWQPDSFKPKHDKHNGKPRKDKKRKKKYDFDD